MNIILNGTLNLRFHDNESSTHELNLSDLSPKELAAWGAEHLTDLSYRTELARRIALTYDDADQIILFDDIAFVVPEWEGTGSLGIRGSDRSLLPALWLSTGFRHGARILVYSPPNSVEIENYLKLKELIEEHLQRPIDIQILYEDSTDHLLNLIQIFEESRENYNNLCEAFARQFSREFYPKYYLDMLQRHIETITQGSKRSFVFPYEMTQVHRRELQAYSDRLKLPDIPTNDKAKHNLFLRAKGFEDLPKLLAVSSNGTLIDNYEQYIRIFEHFDSVDAQNTPHNVEVFARAVIRAIDQLHQQNNVTSFVKLDSSGTGGWSSMSPTVHPIIYDFKESTEKRVSYLHEYIQMKVIGEQLPTIAVVEEFVEPQKRSGDVEGDYTVCGFVLAGKFFPTSISLGDTINGQYIGIWNASTPAELHDSPADWQHLFQTYSRMVALEAQEFRYYNGIYAGDVFLTKDGRHKQHDWNIRRGARSSPESMVIFNIPTYETKVTLWMAEFGLNGQLNNIDLFRIYKQICESLSRDYGIYVLSTVYGYFGKNSEKGDFLKFCVIAHPGWLVNTDSNGQKQNLSRSEHQSKVVELIRQTANKFLKNT